MRDYLRLLRTPGATRLLAGTMPARLAYAMVPLALFFTARAHTGSLTIAGLAVGANTLTGSGSAGPRGSLVDRYGQTLPLLILVPAYAVGLVVLALAGHHGSTFVAVSAAAGLVAPPINMSARPLWKSLVAPEQLRTAWALDSVLLESTAVIGPVLATFLALQVSPEFALYSAAVLLLVGGAVLVTSQGSRSWVGEARDPSEPGLLRTAAIRVMCLEGLAIGLAFGALEIAVPSAAALDHHPGRASWLLASFALGCVLVASARA